jgi:hypothetical protein
MSSTSLVTENTAVREKSRLPIINKFVKLFAVLFWSFVLLKLFFFDIDVYLFNKYLPKYVGLLNYKFVIGISLFAIVLAIVRRKVVVLWTTYVLFFPLILLFWRIPYFIFKQKSWVLAIATINSVIAFFFSFKQALIAFAIYIASAVIIFKASNPYILYGSALVILITLIITYFYRFIMIFKSSKVNEFYVDFLSKPRQKKLSQQLILDESLKNLPYHQLSEKQLEKWVQNLQNTVLYNRIFLFMARKIKNYQESKLNYAFYAITTVFLLLLTIFSFSFINLDLYKVDTNAFKVSEAPSFFSFFYYSFNNLLFNAVDEMKPITMYSQSVSMIESFFALFMGMIFVTLLFSAKSERHTRELDLVIMQFEQRGKDLELFIRKEYNINSIEEALELLQKVQAVFTNFLYKLTDNIK